MSRASAVLVSDSAALVVVDIQERLAAVMYRRQQVVARTALLVRVAAIVGMPIVATRQYPKGLGDHSPEIAAALGRAEQDGSEVTEVDKVAFDCFGEPRFAEVVGATGRSQLLIAGMESHICVCQTTLSGLRAGHDVHVAADACCSREDSNHETALARLAHAGAVISTAESAAYELIGVAGTPEFKQLLGAVKECDASRGGS